ncbi:MAG: DUF1844 domain-containing protein [Candidatus Omnitrophica bacterium]|nr:DUF1844 domain-containing protein [Candidatus Omnitrophota bacterium]
MENPEEKHIDETWKETVQKEKQEAKKPGEQDFQIPEVNFGNFVTSLSLQALISLGEVENPFTSKKEKNLTQAKFLIDTLDMLKEKTVGNLDGDESNLLETIIYELKMKYIQETREAKND